MLPRLKHTKPAQRNLSAALLASLFLWCAVAATGSAQVVFLPTWHVFAVRGSWLVPDRGSSSMGSISRQRSASTRRGLPGLPDWFGGRGGGRSASAGGSSVHATIIDYAEWDAAVLGGRPSTPEFTAGSTSRVVRRHVAETRRSAADVAGTMSLAEIRRLRAAEQTSGASESASNPPAPTKTAQPIGATNQRTSSG